MSDYTQMWSGLSLDIKTCSALLHALSCARQEDTGYLIEPFFGQVHKK